MIRKLSGGRLPSKPVLGLGSPTKFATPPSSITQSQRMSRRVNERAPLKPVAQVMEQKKLCDPSWGRQGKHCRYYSQGIVGILCK